LGTALSGFIVRVIIETASQSKNIVLQHSSAIRRPIVSIRVKCIAEPIAVKCRAGPIAIERVEVDRLRTRPSRGESATPIVVIKMFWKQCTASHFIGPIDPMIAMKHAFKERSELICSQIGECRQVEVRSQV
jgi:hypothetical protein